MKITTAAILLIASLPIPAMAQEDSLVLQGSDGTIRVIAPDGTHTTYHKLGQSYVVDQDNQDGSYLILPLGQNSVITNDGAKWGLPYVPPRQ